MSEQDIKKMNLLKNLRDNILDFNTELVSSFPEQHDFIILRVFLENVPHDLLMSGCREYILPHKEMILKKDDNFFLEKDDMFSMLDSSKVSHFKNLWQNKSTTKDDKDIIWSWMKRFVTITERYNKLCKN